MISWFEKNNKISWSITIIIAFIIFYLSTLTFSGKADFGWKAVAYHFYIFLFLAAFLLISITKGKLTSRLLIITIMISVFYAVLDEIHQIFVPSRSFAISDILIDSAGILFGSLIYSLLRLNYFTAKVDNKKEIRKIRKAISDKNII